MPTEQGGKGSEVQGLAGDLRQDSSGKHSRNGGVGPSRGRRIPPESCRLAGKKKGVGAVANPQAGSLTYQRVSVA